MWPSAGNSSSRNHTGHCPRGRCALHCRERLLNDKAKPSIVRADAHARQDDVNTDLTVMKLSLRTFTSTREQGGQKDLGFIAEVEKVSPLLAVYNGGKLAGVKYANMTALLAQAVQELKPDNDNLRAELKAANDNDAEQATDIEELRRETRASRPRADMSYNCSSSNHSSLPTCADMHHQNGGRTEDGIKPIGTPMASGPSAPPNGTALGCALTRVTLGAEFAMGQFSPQVEAHA